MTVIEKQIKTIEYVEVPEGYIPCTICKGTLMVAECLISKGQSGVIHEWRQYRCGWCNDLGYEKLISWWNYQPEVKVIKKMSNDRA